MKPLIKAAHTPGPWHCDTGLQGPMIKGGDGLPICMVPNLADADLIAAAPALLEAACLALAMMSEIKIPNINTRVGYSANVARAALGAAIAKAMGRI